MRYLAVLDELDSTAVACLRERGRGLVPCCGPFIRLAASSGGPTRRRGLSPGADPA